MIALADYFIKRSFIVNLLTVFLIITGIVVASTMKRDLIPPFQWNIVSVEIALPGATPQEMERYVTFPVEEALRGTPGVERIDSTSVIGGASIQLFYEASYSQMSEAVNMIESRINAIRPRLPEAIRHINVQRTQINDVFLFYLGFSGLDDENRKHRQFYKNFVKAINAVPGISNVKEGLKRRDIYVQLDQEKLNAAEISVSQVRLALHRALNFAPIGQMMIGDDKFAVQIDKVANTVHDIASLPLRTSQYGKTVKLKDVARVRYKNADKKNADFYNGKPGTFVTISKDMSSDSINLKPKVEKIVDEFNNKAPDGIQIVDIANGPQFIEIQLGVLTKNGLFGFAFVIFILMVFLNWRTALMASIGLPVAYSTALIVAAWFGINIDLLSIIGMILVVGILVDDAIIVAEKYVELLEQGLTPNEAAAKTVRVLILPVSGTVLTTIVAFAPILILKSEAARMLFAVPVIVIAALIGSYIECFFMLPNHLAHFVKKAPSEEGIVERFMGSIRVVYKRVLNWVLVLRYPVFAIAMGLLALSYWLGTYHVKHDFKRLMVGTEHVSIYAVLNEANSIRQARRAVKPIEDFLMMQPKDKVENVEMEIGAIAMDGRNHEGFEFVKIKAYINRQYPHPTEIKVEVKEKIDRFLETLDRTKFKVLRSEVEQQESDATKSHMISARVTGTNDDVDFQEIEKHISAAAEKMPAIDRYAPDPERYQKSWVFVPHLRNLNQYGIDHQEVAQQIRSYFTPDEVIETRMNGEDVFVYTEFKDRKKMAFDHLQELTVTSTKGIHVPLSFLGSWRQKLSLKKITHFGGERNLTMDFKISDKSNLGTAREQMFTAMRSIGEKFPSYRVEVVAANEDEERNAVWAAKVAGICIAGVLLIISLILGSVTQALIVGLPIPFSLIGIILALYLHDLPLGIMSMVGLVGTIGMAVNASIVLVDHINRLSSDFVGVRIPRDIIVKGSSDRLRAILLTTITTLVGIFPIAYSVGGESGVTQPLTFSMAWGLSFATLLTLFLLPALLEIREDFLSIFRKLLSFKKTASSEDSLVSETEKGHDQSPEEVIELSQRERVNSSPQH